MSFLIIKKRSFGDFKFKPFWRKAGLYQRAQHNVEKVPFRN